MPYFPILIPGSGHFQLIFDLFNPDTVDENEPILFLGQCPGNCAPTGFVTILNTSA